MKKRTTHKSFLHRFLLITLMGVGLIPLFYFVSVEVQVAEASADDSSATTTLADVLDRPIDNMAFGEGEKLSFDINYGFINAGTATMEVKRLIEYKGRPCYEIVTRANSNRFFSTVYKVEDRVESIIDAVGIFTWRFEKNLREGSYKSNRVCTFDQRQHVVLYKDDTTEVAPFVQDALSALYYVRTQKLEVGKSLFFENFTDGKKYPLEVKVLKKETISVDAGTFSCIVVEPLMRSVGVFKHQGRLKVWLTDDRLKMPVVMKSKILVGSISAELTDYCLGEIEVF